MPTPRMVWGNVNANGSIYSGSGDFRVVKEDTGSYVILYNTPFSQSPSVLNTENYPGWISIDDDGGNTKDNTVLVASLTDRCKIITGNDGGDRKDRNFSFAALGL